MKIGYLAILAILVGFGCPAESVATGQSLGLDDCYTRKSTWHETMWASLEAYSRETFVSPPRRPFPDLGMTDMTIMAWIRTTEGGVIFSVSSATGEWAEHGSKALLIRDGRLSYDAAHVGACLGGTVAADGKWHHVAATYHGTRLVDKIGNKIDEYPNYVYLYVDGQRDGVGSLFPSEVDEPQHIARIGMSAPGIGGSNLFEGDIDELYVHARKLTPAEIHLCYAHPDQVPVDGCVGHWSLDADASDQSGSGNHGTMNKVSPVEGVLGQAGHFGGEAFIPIAESQLLVYLRALTMRIKEDYTDEVSPEVVKHFETASVIN